MSGPEAGAGKTLAELAALVGGEVVRGNSEARVYRVMPTDRAGPGALTFVTKSHYLARLSTTRATAVMLSEEFLARPDVRVAEDTAIVRVKQPYVAFALAAQALAAPIPSPRGIHSQAVIDETAQLADDVSIGPFVYVGPRARISAGAVLHPGVHVHADASVGQGSVLFDHVVIRHGCHVGARCILHPGVVVGADGFGFASDARGAVPVHLKIPQVGDVVIEDDVELGANTCIDRAALGTTRIGAGTKIDNLVQVGHNAVLGPGCILVAQSGVAGSSRLGAAVTLGAQSGISGHLEIGAGSIVYGQSGVMKDLPPHSHAAGSPATTKAEFFKNAVRQTKLDSLFARVKKLERLLEAHFSGAASAARASDGPS